MPAVQMSHHLLPTVRLAENLQSGRSTSYQITHQSQHLFPLSLTRDHLCIGLNETIPEVIRR